jgi:coenzyme F420 biosynthesis associated uncharacterized protein
VGRWAAGLAPVRATGDDVARLRRTVADAVATADGPSRQATGLGHDLGPATARVVGRGEWVASNLASMRWITDPHAGALLRRSTFPPAAARRAVAVQIGLLFGYLSTRVLGQYEVFLPGGRTPGQLTLVGPNLLQVERDLAEGDEPMDPGELVLGVVLHELGHRLQFEGVPWLRPHLHGVVERYLAETRIDPARIREGLGALRGKLVSGQIELTDLVEALLSPEQAVMLQDAQALMSLLEGHGNVVMDWGAALMGDEGVDPARVRRALNARRSAGGPSKLIGRALGLGIKAAQYAVGETFITEVAERHGRETFDLVWADPAHVPTPDELTDPDAWAARVRATT